MDGNDTLRNILISAAVFFLILWAWPKLLPLPPQRPRPSTPVGSTAPGEQPGASGGASRQAPEAAKDTHISPVPLSAQPKSGEPAHGFVVVQAEDERTFTMGSAPTHGLDEDAPPGPFRMRLTLSNVGASIESATMTDYAEELSSDARYRLLSVAERDDGTRYRSLALEKINIDGVDLPLGDKRWHADGVETYKTETQEGERIEFWIEIHRGAEPVLKLTRTFMLPAQARELGRHDLMSTLTVENPSEQAHRVIVTYLGGLGVRQIAGARVGGCFVDCGIFDGTRIVASRKQQGSVTKAPGATIQLYSPSPADPAARLTWAATANTYFTATVAPLNRDETDDASYLAQVVAADLDGSPLTVDDLTVRFVTRAEAVGPGRMLRYPADIYLGEKDGDTFHNVEKYNRRNYYYQISQGFGWCTFSFLVELMIWLINSLYWITRDYGLAIIALVLIVRLILHPITKKGQINTVRMQQKMGGFTPKVEELKKKYGNDKVRLQQETMKLYREHGINPASQVLTCLPMFLQMPIWVALYLSLSNNIQLRHQPLHFTWVKDLTAPDALITFSSPLVIPVLGWTLPCFNLLPLLVAVFMYIQQKLQPKPKPNPGMSDQQRQQQEMMQKMGPMMSIFMLVIFYKMPSGLNLYIMFSSLFGAVEQHRIRKHIKAAESAGALSRPTHEGAVTTPKRKRPGQMSFLEKLQKLAEDAQKTRPRRPAKTKSRR